MLVVSLKIHNNCFTQQDENKLVTNTVSVTPVTGMGVFFTHDCLHQGLPVERGVKYILRTDIMFRRVRVFCVSFCFLPRNAPHLNAT